MNHTLLLSGHKEGVGCVSAGLDLGNARRTVPVGQTRPEPQQGMIEGAAIGCMQVLSAIGAAGHLLRLGAGAHPTPGRRAVLAATGTSPVTVFGTGSAILTAGGNKLGICSDGGSLHGGFNSWKK